MATYGFDINMGGQILEQMKKVEKAMESMSNKVSHETQKIGQQFKEMEERVQSVGRYIVEAFAVERLYEFGKEILQLTAEFEGYRNVIKYASINSYDAGQNLEYVEGAVKRLHLPIKEAIESFSEMQAGFYGTGIEGDRLRKVFEGVSTAATVLHLSAYRFGNVTFALKEIGELGTLQARQMRMLAFSLPGAMELAAKSMKMSEEQFHGAMKRGQISSGQFLMNFSAQLQQHFERGLANAGNSLIAKMNDTKNAFTEKLLDMGERLRPTFISIMNGIISVLDSAPVQAFINNLEGIVRVLGKILPMWLIYKGTMLSISAATTAFRWSQMLLAATMGETTVVINGATVAVEGFETALLSTGVGAFAVILGFLIEKMNEMDTKFEGIIEKLGHLKEATNGLNDAQKSYERIQGAFNNRESPDMTGADKGMMLNEAQTNFQAIGKLISQQTEAQLADAKNNLARITHEYNLRPESQRDEKNAFLFDKERNALINSINGLTDALTAEKKIQAGYAGIINTLGSEGIKGYKAPPLPAGSGSQNEALSTVNLSGAKGGLGEAKTIIIHFHDALQKVTVGVPGNIKEAGQQAVEVILRALNNLAYQQSRTM